MKKYRVIDSAQWIYIENGDIITVDGNKAITQRRHIYLTAEHLCTDKNIYALEPIIVEPCRENSKENFFYKANAFAEQK